MKDETLRAPGKTTIAPNVLLTIARLSALSIPGVSHMGTVPGGFNRLFHQRTQGDGVRIVVDDGVVNVDLYVVLEQDVNMRDISHNIQLEVARAISEMVGMEVGHININIDDIYFPSED